MNYEKLMADKPTVLATFKNRIGQSFDLVEHPLKGDSYPVIVVSHEHKIAHTSDFWEVQDELDYHPVYLKGEIRMSYEFSSYEINIGIHEAFSTRGARPLKAKCPPINTYGAAIWQAVIGHTNPFKMGIGHMLFMDEDKRAVYTEVDKRLNWMKEISYKTLKESYDY